MISAADLMRKTTTYLINQKVSVDCGAMKPRQNNKGGNQPTTDSSKIVQLFTSQLQELTPGTKKGTFMKMLRCCFSYDICKIDIGIAK